MGRSPGVLAGWKWLLLDLLLVAKRSVIVAERRRGNCSSRQHVHQLATATGSPGKPRDCRRLGPTNCSASGFTQLLLIKSALGESPQSDPVRDSSAPSLCGLGLGNVHVTLPNEVLDSSAVHCLGVRH